MAKNKHDSNSSGVYQKLYNATLGRISRSPKNPIPAPPPTAPRVSHVKSGRQQLPSSGEGIPIELLPTQQSPKEKMGKRQGSFMLKMQGSMNDEFSDYIGRVKNRMRSSSNVGNARISSRPDTFNDDVSNYIRRARGKMRTSSTNVAGGNSVDII